MLWDISYGRGRQQVVPGLQTEIQARRSASASASLLTCLGRSRGVVSLVHSAHGGDPCKRTGKAESHRAVRQAALVRQVPPAAITAAMEAGTEQGGRSCGDPLHWCRQAGRQRTSRGVGGAPCRPCRGAVSESGACPPPPAG